MIPIPANIKMIVGTLLAGLIPAGQYLIKFKPQWLWLSGLIGGLMYLDSLFTTPASKQS